MAPAQGAEGRICRVASVNLPAARRSARNTADNCSGCKMRLDSVSRNGSLMTVVAGLPQGSGALCPNRYPSPYGRRRVANRTPPFFRAVTNAWTHRRNPAQGRVIGNCRFDGPAVLTSNRATHHARETRGSSQCKEHPKNNPRLYWPFLPSRRLQLAVTPLSSRRRLAVLAAWGLRLSWAAILPLAPSSVRRATSPIVRLSRTAATNTRRPTGARVILNGTIRADRRGWSLPFSAPALRRGARI